MPIHMNNLLDEALPESWHTQVAAVLPLFYAQEDIPKEAIIGLTFSDDDYIRDINRAHRDVDRATDVLSFPMFEADEPLNALPGEDLLLGDILISVPHVYAQSEAYGHSPEREVLYLFVHGLMHLAGYDHIDEADRQDMREGEEKLLRAIGLERDTHA